MVLRLYHSIINFIESNNKVQVLGHKFQHVGHRPLYNMNKYIAKKKKEIVEMNITSLGNGKWHLFYSYSKLSLTDWLGKKKNTFTDCRKATPFRPFLGFSPFKHWPDTLIWLFTQSIFGSILTCFSWCRRRLYIDNFQQETSILLIKLVPIVAFIKSHQLQLPFLSSSEPSSCDDIDSHLAVVLVRRVLMWDSLRFTSLFFYFYSCMKTLKMM